MDSPIIFMHSITKTYSLAGMAVPVLRQINLQVMPGEYVAIMGTSGSGKSTLMNIVGCLDRQTTGDYFLDGKNLMSLNDDELAYCRNQRIGFVFQQFNLLPRSTAMDNVIMPMVYANVPRASRQQRAREALIQVGLGQHLYKRPNQLSGGQQQRVAIARALVNQPALMLADEPTGALDSDTSEDLLDLLDLLNRQGMTIIMVTHDPTVAARTQRTVRIQDGMIVEP